MEICRPSQSRVGEGKAIMVNDLIQLFGSRLEWLEYLPTANML